MKQFVQIYKKKAIYKDMYNEETKENYKRFIGNDYKALEYIRVSDIYKVIPPKEEDKYVKVLCRHRVLSNGALWSILLVGLPWIFLSLKTTSYLISKKDYDELIRSE